MTQGRPEYPRVGAVHSRAGHGLVADEAAERLGRIYGQITAVLEGCSMVPE